jgi:hypothetical protein
MFEEIIFQCGLEIQDTVNFSRIVCNKMHASKAVYGDATLQHNQIQGNPLEFKLLNFC